MSVRKNLFSVILFLAATHQTVAQQKSGLLDSTVVNMEASATTATGDFAPLWLSANRYGLASARPHSAYGRVSLQRPTLPVGNGTWRVGYAVDFAVAAHHERTLIPQQYYAEVGWKRFLLSLGAKERPMETKNDELSSGAMTLGTNARPFPQLRLEIDWFPIPLTHGWWHWKLHGSYGWRTDGPWQERWARPRSRYSRHSLYHEKALYWRFGREDLFPVTYEIGINMASEFGGTTYYVGSRGVADGSIIPHKADLKAYWQALTCRGSDETDGTDPNTAGNHLGSYVMELRYHGKTWGARAYWERFFEDQSMLTVQYGIRDMLLGGEVILPRNPYVSNLVIEYLTTKDQSGAVYHDYTPNIPDKMNGRDNYYNHLLYTGWQNYGWGIGNPLLTSPIYNKVFAADGILQFYNNRLSAWHFGLSGDPSAEWHWRALLSVTRNRGRYDRPLADILSQTYVLGEATYRPRWVKGWSATLGIGLDHGKLLGNSTGMTLTVRKTVGALNNNK